ncbi:MAG: translation initiation factor IF-2 [Candidatus Solibacter usitatus]|nr:translation initiation factor IF-2 [Candidatus Solibacter usitatus]
MSKIRINVLARELEVKSHLILEQLPELGVTEKLTHSSSIDEDVAQKLRRHYGLIPAEPEAPPEEEAKPVAAAPAVEAPAEAPAAPEPEQQEAPAAEPAGAPAAAAEPVLPVARQPLRPPLAMPGTAGAATTTPQPPAPGRPAVVPAKPIPWSPRPGQVLTEPGGKVLSGPRQPLPGAAEGTRVPVIPRPPASAAAQSSAGLTPPTLPAAVPSAVVAPGPKVPAAPAPAPPAPRAPAKPAALVGQPAQRPVVPPRPDLVARLTQPKAMTPGQPASPRPGVPLRPPASPVPGQPIYKGPIRPGQPMVARPGARPGVIPTGRPGGPRPMHPTSRAHGGTTELAPPGEAQRRAPDKRRQQRDRLADQEGKLRPVIARREAPAGPPPVTREIMISEGITVKELSEKLEVKSSQVIKKLVDRNIFATINQTLDSKLASELAREFGASTASMSYEEEAMWKVEEQQEEKDQVGRAPVVTIMGHVDHGKTSLLDAIRQANVAGKEAGGITQHIGAYHVEKKGRKIVFIDTPGHEAFTRMRSRGAKVTDIVVLVVAADDGVMPQTLEAIDHARAAKVPIIVAINKTDKPDAQPERVKQQLSDRGLLAEDWGGDTVMVPVSAKQQTNLDLLLEMILLVADLQNLKANPGRPAMGAVLEAKLDRGRGPVATVLVRNGTLRVGDFFICGLVFGKVRAMLDDLGQQIREAEPSMPVEVLGLESLPEAGDAFQAVTDTAKAKQIVLFREAKAREVAMAKNNRLTLEQLHKQMETGEVKELPIILKADVGGSAEVLTDTLQKLSNEKVKIRVLHAGVGAITESDVLLASASNAIIVGFNVRPERNAASVAEQERVDIRLHTIIYNLTDEIKKAMVGLLAPVYKEIYKGKAEVKETFRVTKVGMVAGCLVQDGTITRACEIRLLRDNVVVFTGKVGSLRRFKDDVSEVKSGMECGITIENFGDVKQNDVIEAFVSERVTSEMFN